jgi:hypothetical protein
MRGIVLSEEHGVNPSLEQCFVCLKDVGVVLFGKLRGDQEAPRRVCLDGSPCSECEGYMKMGVILISVRAPSPGEDVDESNPYRTGGWVVVKDQAVKRLELPAELEERILAQRMAFIPDDAWYMLGLPPLHAEGEQKEEATEK